MREVGHMLVWLNNWCPSHLISKLALIPQKSIVEIQNKHVIAQQEIQRETVKLPALQTHLNYYQGEKIL